ncbi:MAG TPA: 6,7-dimethyl-8-ribityllumazine synthase [Terriglobales bacterium]|nr:6,7-dimethyl-8-ribityllumazine synthase [Terriglobales bacterium]
MVKAIHIGRSVSTTADFRALVEILEALGLESESAAGERRNRAVTLAAPAGKLSLGSKESGNLRGRAEGTDLLLEVTDPDSVYALLEKRGLKLISDHHEGSSRLFLVELPGGVKAAFFGVSGATTPAVEGELNARGLHFGIVVSRFNSFITDRLLTGALDGLRRTGARAEDIEVMRVPGAFEIPAAARALAETGDVNAIICLGCLLRGETLHYEVIANEVARGIGQSAQETGVPHALGVLTCDTLEQAIDRAGLKSGNKGFEAALSAVEMAKLKRAVGGPDAAKKALGQRQAAIGKNKVQGQNRRLGKSR